MPGNTGAYSSRCATIAASRWGRSISAGSGATSASPTSRIRCSPGDYVVVHVGFAISRVDEAEAHRTFEALRDMSQLDELDWMREFADQSLAAGEECSHEISQRIPRRCGGPGTDRDGSGGPRPGRWVLMEVCGGQTHTIVRQGLDELSRRRGRDDPRSRAVRCASRRWSRSTRRSRLAADPDVIFTSFGDMLRVPGSECDLLQVRARGGQVRVVYSPLDALELARRTRTSEVVFFAVGFETTAPANAMAVWRARAARRVATSAFWCRT